MARYDFFADKNVSFPGKWAKNLMYKKIFKIISDLNNNSLDSVVEIGSGDGRIARFVRDSLKASYVGYEPNKKMADILLDKGFSIYNAVVPPLYEKVESQDLYILSHVIEHFDSEKNLSEVFNCIYQNLKKKGVLFLIFPSFLSMGKEFISIDYTHKIYTNEIGVFQMLNDAGFTKLKCSYHYGPVFNPLGRILMIISQILSSFAELILPRKLTRNYKFVKAKIFFAENVIITGRK